MAFVGVEVANVVAIERFDEVRRVWIVDDQGWSTIQRSRAEVLGVHIRRRRRILTAAVLNPHDDTVIPHLWLTCPVRSPTPEGCAPRISASRREVHRLHRCRALGVAAR